MFVRIFRLHPIMVLALWTASGWCVAVRADESLEGDWELGLETPGGTLPCRLELRKQEDGLRTATIVNGSERIVVSAEFDDNGVVLDFPHYGSRMQLAWTASRDSLQGSWTKPRAGNALAELPVRATRAADSNSEDSAVAREPFLGRWVIQFSDSVDPAVGVFRAADEHGRVVGTFLTTTGDYRFLSGRVQQDELVLSTFDGAHAFLFIARVDTDRKLTGDFWSGNWHHETWTGQRDSQATLPDAFRQTRVVDQQQLATLRFLNLSGQPTPLVDPASDARVTIVELFGSWCPNCHDAAAVLKDMRAEFGEQNLRIVGLAFELSGEFERDKVQLERYIERFDIDYPVLLAGTSDKTDASARFPVVDRIRSFPTLLFIDQSGNIRAVYSGFSGPATGEAHTNLRKRFHSLVSSLLAE